MSMALRAVLMGAGALALAWSLAGPGLFAQTTSGTGTEAQAGAATAQDLSDVMQIGGVVELMRAEGVDYGETLAAEMFPTKGGAAWRASVALIYDTTQMRKEFDAALAKALSGDQATIDAAMAFFGDARGQRILTLELEARHALLDDAAEQAAKDRITQMKAEDAPRLQALRDFVQANDLVEMNVMGALNANLAFYRGLSSEGAFGGAMSEDDMLADVWSQEGDLRAETEEWLYSYLNLAYQPLSDADLAAYQAFSETPDGKRLNAAVFAAFDVIFTRISKDLGVAAARQMQGEDI